MSDTDISETSTQPELIPLTADLNENRWESMDPSQVNLDAEVLLVSRDAGSAYRPNITLARYPAVQSAKQIADATLVDIDDATIIHRDLGTDSLSQLIEFTITVDGKATTLRMIEVVLTWRSTSEYFTDTNVVSRMMCSMEQFDSIAREFMEFVSSLMPDFNSN